jgi:arsenate reductase (thioredoxin)
LHNAGRSQMAAGYLIDLAGGRVNVLSAGSEPANEINPVTVRAMAEEGIDIAAAVPKVLTTDVVQGADVVITMGCGDACPVFPGKDYLEWDLEDPADKPIEVVRSIRDEIAERVHKLLRQLVPSEQEPPLELSSRNEEGRRLPPPLFL